MIIHHRASFSSASIISA